MFKTAVKSELCQVSLTGMRSMVILGLLIEKPRSFAEIKQNFLRYNIIEENSSDDIIRIDINTLKYMGCDILPANKTNNYKYVLVNHPFKLDIKEEEVAVIKQLYKSVKNDLSVETLIEYDYLFKKIAENISDNTIKEKFLGISVFKSLDIDLLQKIIAACNSHEIIKISYKIPSKKSCLIMDILTKEVKFQNEKFYLYGTNLFNKEAVMLPIKRIKALLCKKNNDGSSEANDVKVKFILSEFGVNGLNCDEQIIDKNGEMYIIEGHYHNDFIAKQRILSFGAACTVLEPESFKMEIISLLKKMKEIYKK